MSKETGKIPIGISSCLLGNKVRYNGGHQKDRYITDTLSHYFDFVLVCPEVECGLPVPRQSMRLVGDPESPRLVTSKSGVDHTERMVKWAEKRVRQLECDGLCGFIFKSKSPSSGMARVREGIRKKQQSQSRWGRDVCQDFYGTFSPFTSRRGRSAA